MINSSPNPFKKFLAKLKPHTLPSYKDPQYSTNRPRELKFYCPVPLVLVSILMALVQSQHAELQKATSSLTTLALSRDDCETLRQPIDQDSYNKPAISPNHLPTPVISLRRTRLRTAPPSAALSRSTRAPCTRSPASYGIATRARAAARAAIRGTWVGRRARRGRVEDL